jgi:hypothetical protein
MAKLTRDDAEKVVGEDEFKTPIVDTDIKLGRSGRSWRGCEECGCFVLHETNGKTYYHKLKCSQSNGIGYDDERVNTTLPHHPKCDCYTCVPPKDKK